MKLVATLVAAMAIAAPFAAHAQSDTVGPWRYMMNERTAGVFTSNGAESALGLYVEASTGKVSAVLMNNIGCPKGGSPMPLLISTAAGAYATSATCRDTGENRQNFRFRWTIVDASFESNLARTDTLGIAFPLANGLFRVTRFDTTHYEAAVDALSERVRQTKNKSSAEVTL